MGDIPNLFIVGAPRCGTTSLVTFLSQHPEIFVPIVKEPTYFGSDLKRKKPRTSLIAYEQLYKEWMKEDFALDASSAYLVSKEAAKEIQQCRPDARIVVIVRNPLEACYSLYQFHKFGMLVGHKSFRESFAAQKDIQNKDVIPDYVFQQHLMYSDVYSYSKNISRYFAAFGENNVKVILFDDLIFDTSDVLKNLLVWLDLESPTDFLLPSENASMRFRIGWLQNFVVSPPEWMSICARRVLSDQIRIGIRQRLMSLNSRPKMSGGVDSETRECLSKHFEGEVEYLSNLLNRDLSHWLPSERDEKNR